MTRKINHAKRGIEMRKYLVSFYVELPDGAPIKEVDEFMKFELGETTSRNKLESSLQECSLADFEVTDVDVDCVN